MIVHVRAQAINKWLKLRNPLVVAQKVVIVRQTNGWIHGFLIPTGEVVEFGPPDIIGLEIDDKLTVYFEYKNHHLVHGVY